MFEVVKEWKFNEIDKTPKQDGVFYVLQNQDKSKYHNSKNGGVDTIIEASKYSTVSCLKSAIRRIYYPKNKLILMMNELTDVFEKFELPKNAFDDCTILKVREV